MHKTILRYRYVVMHILSVDTYDTYLCMYDYVLIEIEQGIVSKVLYIDTKQSEWV